MRTIGINNKKGFGALLMILLIVFAAIIIYTLFRVFVIGATGFWTEFTNYGFIKAIIGIFHAIGNVIKWIINIF